MRSSVAKNNNNFESHNENSRIVNLIMESYDTFDQKPQKHQLNNQKIILPPQSSTTQETNSAPSNSGHKTSYQVKCNLLEYHIQEAVLINKALRAEFKQYKDKIDFEKKLRKFLVDRIRGIDS